MTEIKITILSGNLGECSAEQAEAYRAEVESTVGGEYPAAEIDVVLVQAGGCGPRPMCVGFADDDAASDDIAQLVEHVWEHGDWHVTQTQD